MPRSLLIPRHDHSDGLLCRRVDAFVWLVAVAVAPREDAGLGVGQRGQVVVETSR